MPKLSLIAAAATNGVIGKDNAIPWRLPADLRYFRETVAGHSIILGRKNLDSLRGWRIPDCRHIVLTRDPDFTAPDCVIVHDKEAALKEALKNDSEPFVIGGEAIYRLFLPEATQIYLTEIAAEVEGDTYFPKFDKSAWQEISREQHPIDEQHELAFDYVIYQRK